MFLASKLVTYMVQLVPELLISLLIRIKIKDSGDLLSLKGKKCGYQLAMATMFMDKEDGDTDFECLRILETFPSLLTMAAGSPANT